MTLVTLVLALVTLVLPESTGGHQTTTRTTRDGYLNSYQVLVAGTFYGTVPNLGTVCACRLVVHTGSFLHPRLLIITWSYFL